MNKTDRDYSLVCVGKFWTMMSKDDRGDSVASIILPSMSEMIGSPFRCYVDSYTGDVIAAEGKLRACKPSTMYEIMDPDYRSKAESNARLIGGLSMTPSAAFSFVSYLDEWCKNVPALKLRVFYGGDLKEGPAKLELMSIAQCAKRNQDKLIFTRTSNWRTLRTVIETATMEGCDMPDNLILALERISGFTRSGARIKGVISLRYSSSDGENDATFFPSNDDDIVINLPYSCLHLNTQQ